MMIRSQDVKEPGLTQFVERGRAEHARALQAYLWAAGRAVGGGTAAVGGFIARKAGHAAEAMRRHHERAVALRELERLDDALLKDMGLTRGEINAAVDGRLNPGRRGRA